MKTLLKWGVRAYMLVKLLKIVSLSSNRSPQDNLKALTSSFTSTKGALMALSNLTSPGASINPAKQQSRDQARQAVPVVRTATTAVLATAGTDALKIGEWLLRQDDDGNLTAAHGNNQPQVIATRPTTETPAQADSTTTPEQHTDTGKIKKNG